MRLCKAIGTIVSTQKDKHLKPTKLLIVHPIDLHGHLIESESDLLAIDTVDAGVGDTVLVAQEGDVVMQVMKSKTVPANTIILGVVDKFHLD
jgi:ethanolamine utilization protein EutN